MPSEHIIKIERPRQSSIPGDHVLIYDKDRSITLVYALTPEVHALFPKGKNVVYFNATISDQSELFLHERLSDESF